MYPITCAGGYPIPIKKGRFKICGVAITANSTAAASRCTFVDSDDFKIITESQDTKVILADLKGLANGSGWETQMFAEPIQVRDGIAICNGVNTATGRIIVYIA